MDANVFTDTSVVGICHTDFYRDSVSIVDLIAFVRHGRGLGEVFVGLSEDIY